MSNFNKVFLMGNLTRDPKLSYLPSQTAVVDFGMAVNKKWKAKDGQQKSEVMFVDCTAFAGIAETLNKYVVKGKPLFIEGELQFRSWTAKDGSKRSKHNVVVNGFQFLNSQPVTNNNLGMVDEPNEELPF